ncbi:MFS transporter [Luteimonas sp. XNQY3]|nr:MFS transporter [Luteimonas sp. XNQY3]MCD9008193.1 MFS transporter [Luteimonas sp. XNQY3]
MVLTKARKPLVATVLTYIAVASGLDIINPALPVIQRSFDVSVQAMTWLINSNFIAFCIVSMLMGVMGDRYDKRRLAIGGLALFVLGAIVSSLASSYTGLVVGRLLQGVGAAAPAVLSFVLLLEASSIKQHPRMTGMVAGTVAVATCIAPVVGSYITIWLGWRANFALLGLIGASAIILTRLWLPASPGRADVVLSYKAYTPLLLKRRWIALASVVGLVRANYLAFASYTAILYVGRLGVSPEHFGYYQGSLALVFALSSARSPWFIKKFGAERCARTGMWAMAALSMGMLLYAQLAKPEPLMITIFFAAISVFVVFPNNILYPQLLSLMPDARGRASALSNGFKLTFAAAIVWIFGRFDSTGFLAIAAALCVSYVVALVIFFVDERSCHEGVAAKNAS